MFKAAQDNDDFPDLVHYYVFQDGAARIYMGTYAPSSPSVGELRYLFRLTGLESAYKEGDVSSISGGEAIEAEDVFLVDGETRSKVIRKQPNPLSLEKRTSYIYWTARLTKRGWWE